MASDVVVRVVPGSVRADVDAAIARALAVFHDVDRTCTRFAAASDLMRANAHRDEWTAVAGECFDALAEAFAAYRRTDGWFDPRVHDDLVRLGYDRSLTLGPPSPRTAADTVAREPLPPWRPDFRRATREVRLGPYAVDLGGIGKGLAVRWAAQHVTGIADGFLISAGGDCIGRGRTESGEPWRVGVEHPRGGDDPVAVVEVRDEAVATSSVRIRRWQIAGTTVHHLIDPRTGLPGGDGLQAVTVVDPDPATAEVWSKTLFLAGRRAVRALADHYALAALWVDTDDDLQTTRAMDDRVCWRAT
jgi:FAD:protein FMN transferase